jgi:hypothetical protein
MRQSVTGVAGAIGLEQGRVGRTRMSRRQTPRRRKQFTGSTLLGAGAGPTRSSLRGSGGFQVAGRALPSTTPSTCRWSSEKTCGT